MTSPNNTRLTTENNFYIVGRPANIYKARPSGEGPDGNKVFYESGNVGAIEISITTIDNAMYSLGQDYANLGVVSLDAIFCPYTTENSHLKLPYWQTAASGATVPTNKELNPFFPTLKNSSGNYVSTTGNPSRYYESGSNVAAFNSLTGVGSNSNGDLNPYAEIHDANSVGTFARGVGLRAPMVVTGPGYDTAGNPVPADTGDSTKFAPDAFTNPTKWKSGPVDLRWDDSRKVWVTGGGGGDEVIQFSIDSVGVVTGTDSLVSPDPGAWAVTDFVGCHYVIATVTSRGCNTTSVAVGETGVNIYDENACFFNLPIHLLIGMRGTAQKMINPYHGIDAELVSSGNLSCVSEAYLEGPCRWVVTGLCCGEEVL